MGKGKWMRRAVDSQRSIFVNKKHKALWNFSMKKSFKSVENSYRNSLELYQAKDFRISIL